jgi:hypothetical protein
MFLVRVVWVVIKDCVIGGFVGLVSIAASSLSGQEIHRPAGRMIPGEVTPSPAPDPCDACPDPDSFTCAMWPEVCYRCWEDCGSPIATPTPTPTRTPTPTPTLAPGECRFSLPVDPGHPKEVYAVGYYLHESETPGVRYRSNPPLTYDKDANTLSAAHIGRPVAVEWYARLRGVGEYQVVSTCGVVPPLAIPPTPTPTPSFIFKDGFESGNTKAWSKVVS